jgi:hypothetical protein
VTNEMMTNQAATNQAAANPSGDAAATAGLPRLEPLRFARTDDLEVGYFEAGPATGEVVLLLRGFPYDIHSYVEVIPRLVAAGRRVIVHYLRGHGPTRFLDGDTPRSGQQAAIGRDVLGLLDALGIPRAVLAGFDWGGGAACVAAALWPGRCTGVVSVNSYLIQDIDGAMTPIRPDLEAGLWYFFYFLNLGPGCHPGRTGRWQLPGLMTGSWHLPSLLVHVSERRTARGRLARSIGLARAPNIGHSTGMAANPPTCRATAAVGAAVSAGTAVADGPATKGLGAPRDGTDNEVAEAASIAGRLPVRADSPWRGRVRRARRVRVVAVHARSVVIGTRRVCEHDGKWHCVHRPRIRRHRVIAEGFSPALVVHPGPDVGAGGNRVGAVHVRCGNHPDRHAFGRGGIGLHRVGRRQGRCAGEPDRP